MMTESERLLRSLTAKQQETLRRDNPRKWRRNALLKELHTQGVRVAVLSEVSGINRTALYRVLDGKSEKIPKTTWKGRGDITALMAAFKNLVRELLRFIGSRKNN